MKKFSELFTEAGQPFTGYRPRPANDAAALGAAPHAIGEKEFMDLHTIQKAPYLNDSQEKIFNGTIDQPFSTPGHEGNDRGKGNPPISGKLAEKGERDDKPTQGTDASAKVMGKLFGKNRNTSNLTGNKLGEEVEVELDEDEAVEVQLDEAIVDTLKKIAKDKQAQKIKFKNGKTLTVDMQTANLLVKVIGALKPANQKKFADTMEKGPSAFMKMVDFAYSATK